MQEEPGAHGGSSEREPTTPAAGEASLLLAAERLFAAARQLVASMAALFAAEARLFKARLMLVFLAGIALVAFAVSLWACAVALIGWALRLATGSGGVALGLLVALHLVLIAASWLAIKRGIHAASLPETRAELAALGRGWRRTAAGFPVQTAARPGREGPAP